MAFEVATIPIVRGPVAFQGCKLWLTAARHPLARQAWPGTLFTVPVQVFPRARDIPQHAQRAASHQLGVLDFQSQVLTCLHQLRDDLWQ